jgi:ankyrin repeat protein
MEKYDKTDINSFRILFIKCYYCMDNYKNNATNKTYLIIFKRFIEYYDINIHFDDEFLLRKACIINYNPLIKYFLEQGAKPEKSMISSMIDHNNLDGIKMLVEYGIDLRDKDLPWKAIQIRRMEIVKYFIISGIEITTRCIEWAIRLNDADVFKLMVEYGADIHYRNDEALLIALHFHRYEIVKILLENGAQIRSWNSSRTESESMKIYGLLKDYAIDDSTIIKVLTIDNRDLNDICN